MKPTKLVSLPTAAETLAESVNFSFLADHHPLLVCYAAQAERYVFDDPNTALIKLRQFAELLAEQAAAHSKKPTPVDAKLMVVLDHLRELRIVDRQILDLFHELRKAGNAAAHDHKGTSSEALLQLRKAYGLGVWFHCLFGKDPDYKPSPFRPPAKPIGVDRAFPPQVARLQQLEQDLEEQRRQRQLLEQELRQREAQVKELEGKQDQIALERQRLIIQRDQLIAEQHQFASDKPQFQDAIRREIEGRLTDKSKELEDNHRWLEENRLQLVRYREQLMEFQRQVENDKTQLQTELQARTIRLSQLEQANQQLRRQLEIAAKQPAQPSRVTLRSQRWLWGSSIAFGILGLILCLLGLALFGTGWSKSGIGTGQEGPTAAKKPDSLPAFSSQPQGKAEQPKPSTQAEQPKSVPPGEKKPIGPPATEKQMKYLNDLVQRKHWTEKERDEEVVKVLGYVRSYSKLTKQEASNLIDAWKDSK